VEPPAAARAAPAPIARYASLGDRLLAQIVDAFVAIGVFALIGGLLTARFGPPPGAEPTLALIPWILGLILSSLVTLLYFAVCETALGGTLGKLVAEARVQHASGRLITFNQAVIRNGMRLIDGLAFYLVGGIVAMVTPKRQRLGDLLVGSVVVHRPTNAALRAIALILALAIGAAGIAGAWALQPRTEPRIESAFVTDDPSGAASKAVLPASARQIYVVFTLADAPPNTSVRAVWSGTTPLGDAELRIGGIQTGGSIMHPAPAAGWAPGDYRVDLYLNGALARTERFRIESTGPSPAPAQGTPATPLLSATQQAALTPSATRTTATSTAR
jgi:uncharacterized RDD family membrane protein YckC